MRSSADGVSRCSLGLGPPLTRGGGAFQTSWFAGFTTVRFGLLLALEAQELSRWICDDGLMVIALCSGLDTSGKYMICSCLEEGEIFVSWAPRYHMNLDIGLDSSGMYMVCSCLEEGVMFVPWAPRYHMHLDMYIGWATCVCMFWRLLQHVESCCKGSVLSKGGLWSLVQRLLLRRCLTV